MQLGKCVYLYLYVLMCMYECTCLYAQWRIFQSNFPFVLYTLFIIAGLFKWKTVRNTPKTVSVPKKKGQ